MEERFNKHWVKYKIESSEGYSIQIHRQRIEYLDEVGAVDFGCEPSVYRGVDVMVSAREFLELRDHDPQVVIDRFRRAFAAAGWRLRGFDDTRMWLAARPPSPPRTWIEYGDRRIHESPTDSD